MAGSKEVQYATLTTVDNQTFHGMVYSTDENTGKIGLKNVTMNKTKLPGLQYFYASNIQELVLSSERQDLTKKDIARNEPQEKSLMGQQPQTIKGILKNKDGCSSDQKIEMPQYCLGDDSGDQGIGSSSEETENYEDYYEMDNYIMFCRTCDKFRSSITYLMRQDVIAVTFYGVNVCRKGTISLIVVATESDIIIYDILRLGLEGFVDGLQAVMESQDVLKVIHDCRMVSDALFHQYEVHLSNVFDTQVAGVFAFRMTSGGDWPRIVDNLPITLMTHLGLKNKDVHQFSERTLNSSDEMWLQRPLCNQLIQDSLKNVVHMIPLYNSLRAKLLMEFQIGVQMYLDHVRKMPEDRISKYTSCSHLLPYVFQELPTRVAEAAKEKPKYRRAETSTVSKEFLAPLTYRSSSTLHSNCNEKLKTQKDSESNYKGKNVTPQHSKTNEKKTWSVKEKSKLSLDKSNCQTLDHDQSSNYGVTELCSSTPSYSELCRRLLPSKKLESPKNLKSSSLSVMEGNNSLSSLKISSSPSSNVISHRLMSPEVSKTETKRIGLEKSSLKDQPSLHSAIAKSALMKIPSYSCSSASSVCSESLSEPEIEDFIGDIKRGHPAENDWDADRVLELEMSQNILRQARQNHSSKSNIKSRLLPSKIKVSPTSGRGC